MDRDEPLISPTFGSAEEPAPGYRGVRELARRPGVCVLEADHGGRRVALRLVERAETAEFLAELAVLAAVSHPGLARLEGHGALEGGGAYVARTWIEGEPLSSWARERSPDEIACLVVQLGPALEHLHERGFVHGDLKAANVLVQSDGRPVITDFGLSHDFRGSRRSSDVSGSLLALAPELLRGAPPTPRSDVFAIGVMLHGLLVSEPIDGRRFYGHFPSEPFLEAARTPLDSLPEWARTWLERTLARDSARRPASASGALRELARELGVRAASEHGCVRLALMPSDAWGDFVRTRIEVGVGEPEWWRTSDAQDALPLVTHASVEASLRGACSLFVDLDTELARFDHALALDAWCEGVLARARGGCLWIASVTSTDWAARALASFRRAGSGMRIVAAGSGAAPERWCSHAVPPIEERHVLALLEAQLEGDGDERLETLAARLHAESGGSVAVLDELLAELVADGSILFGDERPRLRTGALPAWAGRGRGQGRNERARAATETQMRLLAALGVLRGTAPLHVVQDVSGSATFGADVEAVCRADLARLEHRGREVVLTALVGEASLELDPELSRELHARVAEVLAANDAPRGRVLAHRYSAQPGAAALESVLEAVRALRERGSSELALELASTVAAAMRSNGTGEDPRLQAERAIAWSTLGATDRALEAATALEGTGTDQARALVECIRGHVAHRLRRPGDALMHFGRAARLDPECRPDALQATALVLYEGREDARLQELSAEIDAGRHGALPEPLELNVRSMAAMSRYRTGDTRAAERELARILARASELDEPAAEAASHLNHGNLARARGGVKESLEHFQRAEAAYVRAGHLLGVAQSRTLLGAALRDVGRLGEAEAPLLSALGIRERAGDIAGAAAVRGMLGWLHLERGHVRTAAIELEGAAPEVEAVGRTLEAALLRALALEARSRLGARPELDAALVDGAEREPRLANALARAARAQDDSDSVSRFADAAARAADHLDRPAVAAEARYLASGVLSEDAPVATRQDAEIEQLLRAEGFDARRARALLEELEEAGRDDRAARLALAIARRTGDDEALERARARFTRCSLGLTDEEARFLQGHMLGSPDPLPDDLNNLATNPQESDWEMDVLSVLEINQRLVEQQDLPTLLGSIVENALEVTGAERGFLALEEGGELSLDLALDSRRGDIDEPEVEVSHSILHHAFAVGHALRLSNAAEDPELGAAPSVTALDLRSILVQPFDVQPGLRGAIYLDNRVVSGAFDERAERLLGLLAGQAALAIRQVRRLDEIRDLNSQLGRRVVARESDLKVARRALAEAGLPGPIGGLIGTSAPMRSVHALIERVAASDLAVLVIGESGTGKELAARALHEESPRKAGPFVSENCAALPASLIESELFGFRKGAFTGADRDQAGLFERASGGTLFLDEIGELPIELQAKLLRVLETNEVRRIGESDSRSACFRLVAATNRDLAAEVGAGRFRSDLFYRLDGVCVAMPLLDERVEDIPLLVDHFMCLEEAKTNVPRTCSPEVMRQLCARAWPGNVRELANEVARLCLLSERDLDEPSLIREPHAVRDKAPVIDAVTLAELERQAIEGALERAGGDKRRAAEELGISRAKIYQRLKEWRELDG
ncbi:MAG: protein kinase [bacterium]|nr:protein kinase [bacterium]